MSKPHAIDILASTFDGVDAFLVNYVIVIAVMTVILMGLPDPQYTKIKESTVDNNNNSRKPLSFNPFNVLRAVVDFVHTITHKVIDGAEVAATAVISFGAFGLILVGGVFVDVAKAIAWFAKGLWEMLTEDLPAYVRAVKAELISFWDDIQAWRKRRAEAKKEAIRKAEEAAKAARKAAFYAEFPEIKKMVDEYPHLQKVVFAQGSAIVDLEEQAEKAESELRKTLALVKKAEVVVVKAIEAMTISELREELNRGLPEEDHITGYNTRTLRVMVRRKREAVSA